VERERLTGRSVQDLRRSDWRRAKRLGFGDAQLARLLGSTEDAVREARMAAGVRPTFKTVDTCGAEFEASTPYHYSTYEDEEEVRNVIEVEQSVAEEGGGVVGVIVGLGGQTPLKLAGRLPRHLVLGTSPDAIDLAEDRERWSALCARLEIPQPAGGTATSVDE